MECTANSGIQEEFLEEDIVRTCTRATGRPIDEARRNYWNPVTGQLDQPAYCWCQACDNRLQGTELSEQMCGQGERMLALDRRIESGLRVAPVAVVAVHSHILCTS